MKTPGVLNGAVPYWRLSSFYFFYFASLGALVPYLSLYLKDAGFDAIDIGILLGVVPATKTLAPFIIGWISDLSRRPMQVVRWVNLLVIVSFVFIFYSNSFWWLLAVILVFSFFWNSALPQFEATTLNHLGEDIHRYSVIRLWGSLGFILMVVLLGEVFESLGIEWLPLILLCLFIAIFVASLFVPESRCKHDHEHASILHVLKQPAVISFLLICFLMLLSHGPYYTFYSIYLEDNGYSRRIIGLMWAVGVIAEVVVFIVLPRLFPHASARHLLLVTFAFTSLRWLLIGFFPQYPWIIFSAQLFHAFSFGVFHAVGIMLVHQYFRGVYQGRGQALYASLSFGAGGAIGSLVSGVLWEMYSPAVLFSLAAMVSLLAWLIVWKYIVTPDASQRFAKS